MKFFSKVFKIAAAALKLSPRSRASLFLVGEKEMRSLNFRARRVRKVTDVLSFPAVSRSGAGSKRFPREDPRWLGEIVICLPQAKQQASAAGIPLKQELARLYVHGLLHLVGYNHEKSPREVRRQSRKEEEILAKVKIKKQKAKMKDGTR